MSVALLPIQSKRLEEERRAQEERKANSPSTNIGTLGENIVQAVKENLAKNFRMKNGLATTNTYPLRVLTGCEGDKAIKLIAASAGPVPAGPTITFDEEAVFIEKANSLGVAMMCLTFKLSLSFGYRSRDDACACMPPPRRPK